MTQVLTIIDSDTLGLICGTTKRSQFRRHVPFVNAVCSIWEHRPCDALGLVCR